jgi:hypothetical protein
MEIFLCTIHVTADHRWKSFGSWTARPKSLLVADNNGKACACRTGRVIRYLAEECPGYLLVTNNDGKLPIQFNLSVTDCKPTAISL